MFPRLALFASAIVLGLAPGAPADDLHAVEELIAFEIYLPAPEEDYSLVAYADDLAGQPSEVFPVQPANPLIAAASELRLSLVEPAQEAELATLLEPFDIEPSALPMEAFEIESFDYQPSGPAIVMSNRGEDVQTA